MNGGPVSEAPPSSEKLPFEREHLDAQERMRALGPYYDWVLDRFRPWLGRRILDAGCGIGTFTERLLDGAECVVAADLSERNLERLAERFVDRSRLHPVRIDLEGDLDALASYRLDTIACLDVLEHIADDVALLSRFRRICRPGGHLLVKVPACPRLYGSVDVASGHHRRYRRADLVAAARGAGWTPRASGYMNLAGVIPYAIKSRLLARPTTFSRTFPRWQLGLIRRLIPLLRGIDRLTGPPVGMSAWLVARHDAAP